jgi:hypothetical protein
MVPTESGRVDRTCPVRHAAPARTAESEIFFGAFGGALHT